MLNKNQFYCRGQLFRLDFIEKCGTLNAKGVLRAQRRFFERNAREVIERLSMEHEVFWVFRFLFRLADITEINFKRISDSKSENFWKFENLGCFWSIAIDFTPWISHENHLSCTFVAHGFALFTLALVFLRTVRVQFVKSTWVVPW